MSKELASVEKYHLEDGLERAYSQVSLLVEEGGVSSEDQEKALKVKELLEECYRLTLSMKIKDCPQVAWMRKDGEKNHRAKGRSNPFKGAVEGVK